MAKKQEWTPEELEQQADALLAADEETAKSSKADGEPAARSGKKSARKKAGEEAQEPPRLLTDEEAKKAGILRLDDKQVAALPAASWLMGNEKLRELLARGKKKGKLESAELMDAVDDLNLEGEQMDQLYDSLEALNIDISTEEPLLTDLPDDEPPAEEIAERGGRGAGGPQHPGQQLLHRRSRPHVPQGDRQGAPAVPGRGDRPGPGHGRGQ